MIYTIRRHSYGSANYDGNYASVTLPHLPGIAITADRAETAPSPRVIRREPVKCFGVATHGAVKHRLALVRDALAEALGEISNGDGGFDEGQTGPGR